MNTNNKFMCGAKGRPLAGVGVPTNEWPLKSHQLCRAYRRAPCGQRGAAVSLRNFSARNFPQFPKQPSASLSTRSLFKTLQNAKLFTWDA